MSSIGLENPALPVAGLPKGVNCLFNSRNIKSGSDGIVAEGREPENCFVGTKHLLDQRDGFPTVPQPESPVVSTGLETPFARGVVVKSIFDFSVTTVTRSQVTVGCDVGDSSILRASQNQSCLLISSEPAAGQGVFRFQRHKHIRRVFELRLFGSDRPLAGFFGWFDSLRDGCEAGFFVVASQPVKIALNAVAIGGECWSCEKGGGGEGKFHYNSSLKTASEYRAILSLFVKFLATKTAMRAKPETEGAA